MFDYLCPTEKKKLQTLIKAQLSMGLHYLLRTVCIPE